MTSLKTTQEQREALLRAVQDTAHDAALADALEIGVSRLAQTVQELQHRNQALVHVIHRLMDPAEDLIAGRAACHQLNGGARGMGGNILQETASKFNSASTWRRLQAAIDTAEIALSSPGDPPNE